MKYAKLLMQPHSPGKNVSDENWKKAFGRVNTLDDADESKGNMYEERMVRALKAQSPQKAQGGIIDIVKDINE